MRHVPEIKLIRTDTTLDLSQKAEKVCLGFGAGSHLKAAEAQFRSGRGAPQYLARVNCARLRFPGSGTRNKQVRKRIKIKSEKNKKISFFSESKNAGWISCARCNKASRHITIPGLEFKSSTNDPREFKSSVAVRTTRVRMVLARRLSELQPMRTPKHHAC